MRKGLCEGYKDSKGNQYYLEDLVLNPYFGDVWIIGKYTEQEMKDFETDCPYYLAQWGSRDEYYMDLNEPEGFVIEKHKDEDGYEELLNYCEETRKRIRERIENENTKGDVRNNT